eukprot:CAMPEP_0194530628 /NCGR_PEP_ID=MMETSP0253-20130528/67623_1 /TAXON_ID=2966 /ORGANISM="Noctiluca scintillans" /LENGTH=228 /DNA_ID=CAMNT_0039375883 /DNA_START=15 /DNA_END=703 /DNA_ORIENTATION=+
MISLVTLVDCEDALFSNLMFLLDLSSSMQEWMLLSVCGRTWIHESQGGTGSIRKCVETAPQAKWINSSVEGWIAFGTVPTQACPTNKAHSNRHTVDTRLEVYCFTSPTTAMKPRHSWPHWVCSQEQGQHQTFTRADGQHSMGVSVISQKCDHGARVLLQQHLWFAVCVIEDKFSSIVLAGLADGNRGAPAAVGCDTRHPHHGTVGLAHRTLVVYVRRMAAARRAAEHG